MNRNNEVCNETNKICQAKYKWKKDLDKIKKDRMKDLYPSIKIVIKNASAIKRDKAGKLNQIFLSLYNSKTQGSLDIQLHQLFKDVGMGDINFAKGVSSNMQLGWDLHTSTELC